MLCYTTQFSTKRCYAMHIMLCRTMLYYIILYQIISEYIKLYRIIIHYIPLYCTVLCYAIFDNTILYYTYYAIYCQILPGARHGPSEAVDLGPCASQLDQPSSQPSWLAPGKNWPSGNSSWFFIFLFFIFYGKIIENIKYGFSMFLFFVLFPDGQILLGASHLATHAQRRRQSTGYAILCYTILYYTKFY